MIVAKLGIKDLHALILYPLMIITFNDEYNVERINEDKKDTTFFNNQKYGELSSRLPLF